MSFYKVSLSFALVQVRVGEIIHTSAPALAFDHKENGWSALLRNALQPLVCHKVAARAARLHEPLYLLLPKILSR